MYASAFESTWLECSFHGAKPICCVLQTLYMSIRVLIDHTVCEKRRDFNEVMATKQTVSLNMFTKSQDFTLYLYIPRYSQLIKNILTDLSTFTASLKM